MVSFAEVAFYNPVLGVFLRPLSESFGWSRAAISVSISLGTLVAALIGPLLGPYLDRRGPRLPLVAAILAATACAVILSGINRLWQFQMLFGAGRALTQGVMDVAVTVTVAKWFITGRGRAMSIIVASQRLGFAVLPFLAQVLLLRGDYRLAWWALGLIVLILGLVPSLLVIERRPEDRGLLPDGRTPDEEPDPSASARIPPDGVQVDLRLRQALRTPIFWLLTFAIAQAFLTGGAINLHQLAQMEDRGIPPAIAAGAVGAFAVASAVGALISSWPRRWFGSRVALGLYLLTSAASLLILIGVHHTWQAYTYAAVYGLSFGGQLTMIATVYADVFGRTHLGAIRGAAIPIQLVANAIGPVFAGWVHDHTGSYGTAFSIFAALYLLAAIYCLATPDVGPTNPKRGGSAEPNIAEPPVPQPPGAR